jgi:hypothetical protein
VPGGSAAQGAGWFQPSPNGSVATHGPPQRDGPGQGHLGWDVQQFPQFVLDVAVPHGDDAAVPQGAGGQQQVLACRIHRGPLGGVRIPVAHQAGQHHHRRGLEVGHEVFHRGGHAGLGRVGLGARALVIAVPAPFLGPQDAERLAQQRLGLNGPGPIAQHHEPGGLTVAAGRGPGGVPQDRVEVGLGYRLGAVAADGAGGGQAIQKWYARVLIVRRSGHGPSIGRGGRPWLRLGAVAWSSGSAS